MRFSRLWALGLAIVLCSPLAAPAPGSAQQSTPDQIYAALAKLPAPERLQRLIEGARKEGHLTLVHTWRGQEERDHVALFEKQYPFIKVDVPSLGSQDAVQNFVAEETVGRHITDVISVAVPDLDQVLQNNLAAHYITPATKAILPQYRRFLDPQGRWTPWYWSEHGMSYNTKMVPPDKAPKSWQDLCNPYFKGNVSYDPGETRFLAGLYSIFGDAGTEKLIKCIGANKPIVQRGHDDRMTLMLAGDHMMQGDNYMYQCAKAAKLKGAPCALVYSAPIIAFAGAAVISAHAQHPYAAALWVDWALSKESQDDVASIWRGPVTEKHPFLPATVKLVPYNLVPAAEIDRLQGYWHKYIVEKS